MSSTWGRNIKLSIFGESHGEGIGVVIDGLPHGIKIDKEELLAFMARRAPGKARFATERKEADLPLIQSGYHNGYTTGTPLCAVIKNTNTRSGDYADIRSLARPGHADYTGFIRYGGFADTRGGGHFSARLTAPFVFVGGIAKQILAKSGIFIGGHIASVAGISDISVDSLKLTKDELSGVVGKSFPVFDDVRGEQMLAAIEEARLDLDSVGGIVECFALNVPAGIGSPVFDGIENSIASIVFGIPAVKGIEFGAGFSAAEMRGSENNDPMEITEGKVCTLTNNHGGILGGITSGMPLVVRVAFKPTPSIAKKQRTVDYINGENAEIEVHGRHDPCVVPRALPCVEACVALALLDSMMDGGNIC